MIRNNLARIFLIFCVFICSACKDRTAVVTRPENFPQNSPEEPTFTPASLSSTPTPEIPTPAPEPYQIQPPGIRLDWYLEQADGSIEFWVYVLNPNPEPLSNCEVLVVLYDSLYAELIENRESCAQVEAFSEYWLVVVFDESFIPDSYATYNIFVEASSPTGEVLKGQLNDQPLAGQDGVEVSQDRVIPKAEIQVSWDLPPEGYIPGQEIQVQMETRQVKGQLEGCKICLQVSELRDYTAGGLAYTVLSESCREISNGTAGEKIEPLILRVNPSGYSWIEMEDSVGTYIPLEISARAEVLKYGIPLAESDVVLHLPPLEVILAEWEGQGVPVEQVRPETPYTINLVLTALASDPHSHTLQLSVRYSEQDPEEWLFSGLLLFIPCLFGFCKDEAVVYTQEDEITLTIGDEITYSIPIQLPQEPTGEAGLGGYYILALTLDEVTIWRGGKAALDYGSD